jgi:hypothetical protein
MYERLVVTFMILVIMCCVLEMTIVLVLTERVRYKFNSVEGYPEPSAAMQSKWNLCSIYVCYIFYYVFDIIYL